MKTTVEIADTLAERARRRARQEGRSLRSLIEAGLRQVLDEPQTKRAYQLPDRSTGHGGLAAPYAGRSVTELVDDTYCQNGDDMPA